MPVLFVRSGKKGEAAARSSAHGRTRRRGNPALALARLRRPAPGARWRTRRRGIRSARPPPPPGSRRSPMADPAAAAPSGEASPAPPDPAPPTPSPPRIRPTQPFFVPIPTLVGVPEARLLSLCSARAQEFCGAAAAVRQAPPPGRPSRPGRRPPPARRPSRQRQRPPPGPRSYRPGWGNVARPGGHLGAARPGAKPRVHPSPSHDHPGLCSDGEGQPSADITSMDAAAAAPSTDQDGVNSDHDQEGSVFDL